MKISVVNAVFNRQATIQNAIDSVIAQKYDDIEHIVIDGMSDDGTSQIIQANSANITLSIREPDEGIYDALNKGIRVATGDVIGFLHADDMFADDEVLTRIHDKFAEGQFDAVYGDLVYVDFDDPQKIVRYWRSGPYSVHKFRRGWMPPHPTVYVRKEIYEQFGGYRIDLGSAADYECMIRLMFKHRIRVGYLPDVLVRMRVGGKSNASIKNRMAANRDDRQAWIENGLIPPIGLRFTKPFSKLPQYFRRPSNDYSWTFRKQP